MRDPAAANASKQTWVTPIVQQHLIRYRLTSPALCSYYQVPKTEPPATNYYIVPYIPGCHLSFRPYGFQDMEHNRRKEERGPGVVSDRMSPQNVALLDVRPAALKYLYLSEEPALDV